MKKLAIVIPHYNGEEILRSCLHSLNHSATKDFNIYVVDNGSSDSSVEMLKNEFSDVNVIISDHNRGYAGGCNYGFEQTSEEYILFYNNDTELEPDAIEKMITFMDSENKIGALQPKLISFQNKEKFDYSGACGGEIDWLGYPFTRGRIFDTIENDENQYDNDSPYIFWASGTAMLVRRKAIDEVGSFDEDFFAHMEEIDLSWRMQQFGWKIAICSEAIVYHYSGYTLGAMNPQKMYLNHRNNLLMLYKNLDESVFKKTFRYRYLLEFITVIQSILTFDFNRAKSVIRAFRSFQKMKNQFQNKRNFIQSNKTNHSIRIFQESIVKTYFIKSIKTYRSLNF